jgi:hypothetical protein
MLTIVAKETCLRKKRRNRPKSIIIMGQGYNNKIANRHTGTYNNNIRQYRTLISLRKKRSLIKMTKTTISKVGSLYLLSNHWGKRTLTQEFNDVSLVII